MTRSLTVVVIFLVTQLAPSPAHSQWGGLLREGVEMVVKGSGKVVRKGVREGIEHALPKANRLVSPGVLEASEVAAKNAVRAIGRESWDMATQHASHVCRTVTAQLGDDGARALASLSREGGEKLAQLAPELARIPQASPWLATIATHGDRAVAWLWQRKASLAVGTAATAVLLRPADFLEASEQVAKEVIHTTGQHVMRPLIEQTASHVAEPLIREAATPAVRQLLPTAAVACVVCAGAGSGWYVWRRQRRRT